MLSDILLFLKPCPRLDEEELLENPFIRIDIHGVFLSPIIAAGLGLLILAACYTLYRLERSLVTGTRNISVELRNIHEVLGKQNSVSENGIRDITSGLRNVHSILGAPNNRLNVEDLAALLVALDRAFPGASQS